MCAVYRSFHKSSSLKTQSQQSGKALYHATSDKLSHLQRKTWLEQVAAGAFQHLTSFTFCKRFGWIYIFNWCLMSVSQILDGSDQVEGVVSVNNLNIILWPDAMVETINTALRILGLTGVDITIMSVKIFQNQCNVFPPETLFHMLLDDEINDHRWCGRQTPEFLRALTTLATSMWGHHSSMLTSAAV